MGSPESKLIWILVAICIFGFSIFLFFNYSDSNSLIIATTTSTRDSGLFDVLIPDFEKKHSINVKLIAVGTGKALQMGEKGEADLLITHAPEKEIAFVTANHGIKRIPFMYNEFLILGPEKDPAGIASLQNQCKQAFQRILDTKSPFVSRADNSGTHIRELSIWNELNIKPSGDWYLESGTGMTASLQMASEKKAYILCDNSTYLNWKSKIALKPLFRNSEKLKNTYSIIRVNPEKSSRIQKESAEIFEKWLLSQETRKILENYGKEKWGTPLFNLL